MKGMKGKLLKKLKTVKQIGYLNPDRILQVSALDGFADNFHLKSTFVDNFPFKSHNKPHFSPQSKSKSKPKSEKTEIIDVEELMRAVEEDEKEELNKENICPSLSKHSVNEVENVGFRCKKLKKEDDTEWELDNDSSSFCKELKKEEKTLDYEIDSSSSCYKELEKRKDPDYEIENSSSSYDEGSSFRRPNMNSRSLFDPKLLVAFKEAVEEHKRSKEKGEFETSISKNHRYPFFQPENENDPLMEFEDESNPLEELEEKCPPGGENSVIFYTTSLRGIRKTFEDCQSIRFLLESFGLMYYERDVSIHSKYRDELWETMEEKCLPPRLFVRGRYIGGAEQVLRLNEQGELKALFRDIPIDFRQGPCNVCSGLRFMLCYHCNGSRKVFEHHDEDEDDGDDDDDDDGHGGVWTKCLQCNENGLVVCPLC